MPVRLLAILAALLAVTFGILFLAWLTESDVYLFLPSRWRGVSRPPTHPMALLFLLIVPFVITIISRRYGIIAFTLFPVGLLLGSGVGYFAFQWTPSLCQHLLCLSAFATAGYAWSQREYLD